MHIDGTAATLVPPARHHHGGADLRPQGARRTPAQKSDKDKGGPSKGSFPNNLLFC